MSSVEELAARVARLEELESQRRDVQLEAGLHAQAFGLSLVHTDTQAIRAELTELRAEMTQRLDDLGRGVTEILSRLPEQR